MKFTFFICLSAIASWSSIFEMKQDFEFSIIEKDSTLNETQYTYITVDVESVNLSIYRSNSAQVKIVKALNEKEVTYEETISAHEIKIVSKGKKNSVSNPGEVEIHIPKYCIIICKMMSGNLKISEIACESISVVAMSSEVELKNISSKKVNIKTMSGSIYFSGLVNDENLILNSMSGNVDIILNDQSSVKIELESEKSKVSVDGKISQQNTFKKILNRGQGLLSGYSMSGDVSLYIK